MINLTPFQYAGSIALMLFSVILFVFVLSAVDEWHDDWRDFALQTNLAGDPSCAADPSGDDSGGEPCEGQFQPWMIVPWGLAVGSFAACLAIALPIAWHRNF